jgi:hypothetical protein
MNARTIAEYETVFLKTDLEDVPAGTIGVVLMVFEGGKDAEVEFTNGQFHRLTYTVPIEHIEAVKATGETEV